jgi:hypothetical protein
MTAPATGDDVAVLQTATSLVVLALSTYTSLQALPAGGGASGLAVVRDHLDDAVTTLRQARADLGAATRQAGGRVQQQPDPVYAPVVAQALPTVRSAGDVVGLALTLEDVLAQTLVADVAAVSTPALRRLCGSLAAGAAERKARLLIVSSLLSTGSAQLVAAPPDLAALPAGTGTVGFPDTRFPTDKAAPAQEGAL